MTSQIFRNKSGYEDLDKSNQSSDDSTIHNDNNSSRSTRTQHLHQQRQRILSMSDTAIHLTPQTNANAATAALSSSSSSPTHNQSTLSLSNSFGIGSICLPRRPRHSIHSCGELPDNTNPSMPVKCPKHKRKENIWLICYVLLYAMYLSLGGLCFQIIETPIEQDTRKDLRVLRQDFLMKYPLIVDDDLEEFLSAVITANDRGISPLRNASNEMNWSFGQALFFSSTVVTTIGYGHVTPLSQTGKIFCMIYATIGIPLTLVLLSAVVERLLVPANWLLGSLNSKLGHLYQPFNIRLLHLSIVVMIVATLFFAIPTVVFAWLEPAWGTLDAFYYCFISLTTIGLGDYIPGDGVSADNRSLYKMFITGYLVCGLIAMMFVLSIFYDIPQLNLGQLFTETGNVGETEKLRLSSNNATCYSGPYMPQRDEDTRRAVVRIRPHGDDSPSPDEAPPSSLSRIP